MNQSASNPFRPWRHPLRLWRLGCFNVTALPVGVVTFTFIVTFLALGVGLLVLFPIAVLIIWLMFILSRAFARFERHRVASLAGVRIPDPVPPLTRESWFGRLRERVGSGPRWREIGYHVALLPIGVLGYVLTLTAWCGSMAALALPLYVDALPGDTAKLGFMEISSGTGALGALAVGLAGLAIVAPWVTMGSARLNVTLAKVLLGPSADAVHAAEVRTLETRRTAAVDSAEAERRRIERDLHDGAQQRLVALAANLGAAKEKLDADPESGRRMVAEAHEEAKAALREVRDLVRGIHPVILEDRGLDAALSAIVARSPVPVTIDVQVAKRPPAAVESAAYFVVTEALTNVAKHAEASRAAVSLARAGDRLVVEIRDNGKGGADPDHGSGLQGLRDRVAGLGGAMYVVSPEGGPTTISVELPCGS